MKVVLISISFLILVLLNHISYAQTFEENAKSYLNNLVKQGKFSGTVLVAKNGNILLCKGYGSVNLEDTTSITPDYEFRIGSITKSFVSVLIMQLVEQNKISLEEPIFHFFPQLEPGKKEITIKQLLQQTSGIGDYTDSISLCPAFLEHPVDPGSFIHCVNNLKLEFAPGTHFSYSNTNYFLLGLILEKITGLSFEQILLKNILIPLQMMHTGYKNHSKEKFAQGFTLKDNKLVSTTIDDIDIAYTAGGMYSTVNDLYLFDRALRTEKLLKKASLKEIFSENPSVVPSYYGFGWNIDSKGSYRTFHEGGIDGFSSCIDRYINTDICIIALSNLEFAECRIDVTEPLSKLLLENHSEK